MPEDQDAGGNPCLQNLPDKFGPLAARVGEAVQFRLWLCETSARVIVTLDRIDQPGAPTQPLVDQICPKPNPLVITLGALAPGRYRLAWTYLATTKKWKVVGEVLIAGLVRFRHAKASTGAKPFNSDSTTFEVLP